MEKNTTAMKSRQNTVMEAVANMARLLHQPAEWLRAYYSRVLERDITMRQTALLVNAQAAFAVAFFPVEAPLMARVAGLLWVGSALLKCRREL